MALSFMQRFAVGLLRLPGRTLPIPGWFPLVIEPVHARIGLDDRQRVSAGGRTLELDLSDYVQRRIYYNAHEIPEARWISRFLRSGDRVLDIGANVGYFTLLAAVRVGNEGRVEAIEPIPQNILALRNNIASSRREDTVQVHELAAGSDDGTLSIGLPVGREGAGAGTSGDYSAFGTVDGVEVPVRRIDRVFADQPQFSLVKVDVEGMEPAVLAGMTGLLEAAPPRAILLELNPRALAHGGFSAQDVFAPLERHGYGLFHVSVFGRTGRRVSAEDFPAPTTDAVNARGLRLVIRGLRKQDRLDSVVAVRLR